MRKARTSATRRPALEISTEAELFNRLVPTHSRTMCARRTGFANGLSEQSADNRIIRPCKDSFLANEPGRFRQMVGSANWRMESLPHRLR